MSEQQTHLLVALAAKLNTTAEHLWGVLVTQARLSAVGSIFTLVIITLALVIGAALLLRARRRVVENSGHYDIDAQMLAAAAVFCAGIAIVVFACTAPRIVTQLINPEYWALKQILGCVQ